MKNRFFPFLWIAAVVLFPSSLVACLWDYDTLQQERSRFPTTLELITGKFLRHSSEFYQWRIEDRLKKLQSDPNNLAWHDDLGVAYDKTGQHDKAIAMMEAKETIQPGLYETYANWGTFLIHKGEFSKGLPYIDKAIAINRAAHFGREIYQKWLAEYVAAKTRDGKVSLPLGGNDYVNGLSGKRGGPFQAYLSSKLGVSLGKKPNHRSQAIKGILGIMRFSKHDSPIILEVLGDLLIGGDQDFDAKHLGVRAYLKASYDSKDPEVKHTYREMARHALMSYKPVSSLDHSELSLDDLEADFQRELQEAQTWYAELKTREIGWIQQGVNPEKEFDRYYPKNPIVGDFSSWLAQLGFTNEHKIVSVILLGMSITIVTLIIWKALKARNSTKIHP